MPPDFTTSAVSIQVLVKILYDHGVSRQQLVLQTGLAEGTFDHQAYGDPELRIPLDQYLGLWQKAIEVTGDEALGLHLKRYYQPKQVHFVSGIIQRSESFVAALNNWARYCKLICEADQLEVRHEGQLVQVSYRNLSDRHQNRWTPELYFSLLVELFQKIVDGPCEVDEVWMQHKDPGYSDEYAKKFQTEVQFSQPGYRICWRLTKGDMPLKSHDPYYQKILTEYADENLGKLRHQHSFALKVGRNIESGLIDGIFDAAAVASHFHMDRRTLHRKLALENTSFKLLLLDTRKRLAVRYLEQNKPLMEITHLLGFSSPNNFQTAFKRWFGVTPGKYRKNNS